MMCVVEVEVDEEKVELCVRRMRRMRWRKCVSHSVF